MGNKINCASQVKNLRSKLRDIDARRRYPKTEQGRREYVTDSLAGGNVTPWWMEAIICIVISPFLAACLVYAGVKWLRIHLKRPSHEN